MHIDTITCKLNLAAVESILLVAIKKERLSNSGDNINGDYRLSSAEDIFINDNSGYQQIFNPLTAPEETYLENLCKVNSCIYYITVTLTELDKILFFLFRN